MKTAKKIIAVLLCFVMLSATQAVNAFAVTEYTYDNFTYTVNSKGAVITFYPETAKGAVEIPSQINGNRVIAIDDYAFASCTLITEVEIPRTVQSIGNYAFAYCTSLSKVTIPSSVTSIGNNAFQSSRKVTLLVPISSYAYNYALVNSLSIEIYEENTFSYDDAWGFANTSEAFIGEESSYYIPAKRYEEVFGKSYVDNNTIPNTWGGNCFGMSASTVLFYTESLNWSDYDALYENDFSTVNSYYNTIRYEKPFGFVAKQYYIASDYDTPVTKLIERYQIVQNSSNSYHSCNASSWDDLYENYYEFSSIDETEFSSHRYYTHLDSGEYIKDIYDKLDNSEDPLLINMFFQDGGHTIVSRTDKEPMDLGNGWYRIYVYDPNYPLMPDGYVDGKTLRSYYSNELYSSGEDRYVELNPTENKFRYKGFLNADYEATEYWGCDSDGDVLYITNSSSTGGVTYTESYPHLLTVLDTSCLPTSFNGSEPWLSATGETSISINEAQSFNVYNTKGKLIAIVEDGVCTVIDSNSASFRYNSVGASGMGVLEFDEENYKLECIKGTVECIGDDSVISMNSDSSIDVEIDGNLNRVAFSSSEESNVSVRVSNIENSAEYVYAKVDGKLSKYEDVSLDVTEDNILNVESSNEDSALTVSVKTESESETEIGSVSVVDGYDIRNKTINNDKVVSVFTNDISLTYKSSTTITPTVEVDGDVDYTVTYESSDTSVAAVDENGRVTTNGTGSAEITVTVTDEYGNTVTDTCEVNVSYAWWQWIIVIVLFGWIWY